MQTLWFTLVAFMLGMYVLLPANCAKLVLQCPKTLT